MKLAARSKVLVVVIVAVAVAVVACGSKPPAGGTGPGAAQEVLPDVPFEQLDHAQRIQFMKQVVVPTMQPIFQRHDAEHYKDFGCKTCHGEGADRGEFHLPNAKLPKLNFADLSKFKQADVDWMTHEVKPTMARLLAEPESTPEHPKGFGCLECHTQEP